MDPVPNLDRNLPAIGEDSSCPPKLLIFWAGDQQSWRHDRIVWKGVVRDRSHPGSFGSTTYPGWL
jgi:hypothetical protein